MRAVFLLLTGSFFDESNVAFIIRDCFWRLLWRSELWKSLARQRYMYIWGQLNIDQAEGLVSIPLEDIATIVCRGANIRLSVMDMEQICANGITLMIQNEKYTPAAMLLPYQSYARQSMVMKKQIAMRDERIDGAWAQIIQRKIENQALALNILGKPGADKISKIADSVCSVNTDAAESSAARAYFQFLYPRINRKAEIPINSCLNYGYAVLRNAIIRSLLLTGFIPAFGLHHRNQLNTNNLADDLIEPWRPMVDIIAIRIVGSNQILSKKQRYELAHVLHNACLINGKKMAVLTAIDIMTESLRNFVINDSLKKILLPTVLPEEPSELLNQ